MKSKIYNERKRMEVRENALYAEIELIGAQKRALQSLCEHKIVFKFDDQVKHRIDKNYPYVCPVCKYIVDVNNSNPIEQTAFGMSKIIDLTGVEYSYLDEIFGRLEKEVIDNFDYYYSDASKEEIKNKLVKTLNKKTE